MAAPPKEHVLKSACIAATMAAREEHHALMDRRMRQLPAAMHHDAKGVGAKTEKSRRNCTLRCQDSYDCARVCRPPRSLVEWINAEVCRLMDDRVTSIQAHASQNANDVGAAPRMHAYSPNNPRRTTRSSREGHDLDKQRASRL
jgi:hypothetical protein